MRASLVEIREKGIVVFEKDGYCRPANFPCGRRAWEFKEYWIKHNEVLSRKLELFVKEFPKFVIDLIQMLVEQEESWADGIGTALYWQGVVDDALVLSIFDHSDFDLINARHFRFLRDILKRNFDDAMVARYNGFIILAREIWELKTGTFQPVRPPKLLMELML